MFTWCIGFKSWYYEHLEHCLRSISAQMMPNDSLVVCDLGSYGTFKGMYPANPLTAVFNLATSHKAKFISYPRRIWSRSLALNRAAMLAETSYLVFTDADMIFPRSWRTVTARNLGMVPGVFLTKGHMLLTPSRDLPEGFCGPWSDGDLETASTQHPLVGQGAAMVVAASWFRKVGGFDERYTVWGCEDNDLVYRMEWDGGVVLWQRDNFVAHQWHDRTATPEMMSVVRSNREYLAQRIAESGPIVRNR